MGNKGNRLGKLKANIIYLFNVCVCVCVVVRVEVREQLSGISSEPTSTCGSQELNSGSEDW